MLVAIPGYIGSYVMDLSGNVYSLAHKIKNVLGRTYTYKGKPIKTIQHCTGYKVIHLCKNGKPKMYRHHRLVALTFIDNPENKEFVNHKDGDKTNNHPSNLEWCTAKENSIHAIEQGLYKEMKRDRLGKYLPYYTT